MHSLVVAIAVHLRLLPISRERKLQMSKSRNSDSPESRMEDGENQSSMDSREKQFRESDVASRAYERWQRRGQPDGSAEEDWFEAERELESHETGAPV
jgi:hypothetical protein